MTFLQGLHGDLQVFVSKRQQDKGSNEKVTELGSKMEEAMA